MNLPVPDIGVRWYAAMAVGVFLVSIGAAAMLVPAEPEPQPVDIHRLYEAADGQCVLVATVDPSALDGGDRIVVEVGGHAALFDERKRYSRHDVEKGSNVTAYAIEMPGSGPLGSDGKIEFLVDGHLGPECELVRGDRA